MTPEEFEELARQGGYGTPKAVDFAPSSRSQTHRHDRESFVFVVSGTFILNTAKGAPAYQPGETCILAADTDHAEEAGPDGASILVARR